jgi:hypothetical protein
MLFFSVTSRLGAKFMRFGTLITVAMKITILSDTMMSSMIESYRRFG